jgi:SP family sugar:H+ symporter-like MFS transporter
MDKYEAAAKSLAKLRRLPVDHPAIIEELNEVQSNHLYEMVSPSLPRIKSRQC